MKRKNEAYCVGHRSLLHWASKPVAMGIEAGCIFGTVKHPASTHLTEEPYLCGSNVYQGSGFFIGEGGLAVSNYHVYKGTGIGAEAIKMPNDDTAYKVAEIYQRNEDEDFIIFRVDYDNDNYIPIASKRPQIGERVFAIGSPRGQENTFSSGEVSQWRGEYLMQISALIDHGSSGGALINEYGEAVGITSGTFADGSQANLNYAWSIDVIKPYVKME